jgi:hypothetical protein
MPLTKRPYVASADQIRITRKGDDAIIEYADDSVATTHLKVGAEKLADMSDEQLLDYWNELVRNHDGFRDRVKYVAKEIPLGKPQVEYSEQADQWVPRGNVLRCELLADLDLPDELEEPFVSIDGRDFSLAEFVKTLGTYCGWGMRIEFVPADEMHIRPKLRVKEPKPEKR